LNYINASLGRPCNSNGANGRLCPEGCEWEHPQKTSHSERERERERPGVWHALFYSKDFPTIVV